MQKAKMGRLAAMMSAVALMAPGVVPAAPPPSQPVNNATDPTIAAPPPSQPVDKAVDSAASLPSQVAMVRCCTNSGKQLPTA